MLSQQAYCCPTVSQHSRPSLLEKNKKKISSPWVEINSKSSAFRVVERTETQLHFNSVFIPDVLREQESGIWNLLAPTIQNNQREIRPPSFVHIRTLQNQNSECRKSLYFLKIKWQISQVLPGRVSTWSKRHICLAQWTYIGLCSLLGKKHCFFCSCLLVDTHTRTKASLHLTHLALG